MEPTTNLSAAAAAPAYDRLNPLPMDIQRRVFSFMPAKAVGNLQSASATNRQWQLRVSAFEKKCGIDPTVCEHLQIGKDLHLQMKACYELLNQAQSKIQEIAQTAVAQHLSAPDRSRLRPADLCGLLVHAGFFPQAIEKASSLNVGHWKDVAFRVMVKALSETGNIAEAKKQAAFINSDYIKLQAANFIVKAQVALHDISGAKKTIRDAAAIGSVAEFSSQLDPARCYIVFFDAFNGDFAAAEETFSSIKSSRKKSLTRVTINDFRSLSNTDKHAFTMMTLISTKGELQAELVRTSSSEEFPRGRVVEYGAIPKSLLNDLSRFKEALRELYGK